MPLLLYPAVQLTVWSACGPSARSAHPELFDQPVPFAAAVRKDGTRRWSQPELSQYFSVRVWLWPNALRQNGRFEVFSLYLSRACLGKIVILYMNG
jgi:hypothetical protein